MIKISKADLDRINTKVDKLIAELTREGVCSRSLASALMHRGAFLLSGVADDKTAISELDAVIALIEQGSNEEEVSADMAH
jgi:hypothetical protein